MKPSISKPLAAWLALAAALAITAIAYLRGLYGGFTYDDMSFVVGNIRMQVKTLDLNDWVAAALSFPGGAHQGRWLAMLSFALNHYFTALDPFWFKLTNLAIHLLNGFLVFGLLRALFRLRRESAGPRAVPMDFDANLAAAAIAALWLVLPINLTAVLYVSQRLESLSTTFVLAGLWWYLSARLRHWKGGSATGLWLSLLVCTGLGALVKESAVLLPLYAACAEFVTTHGRNRDGTRSRPITALFVCLLALPCIAGFAWLCSWIFGPQSYARSFSTIERLLTESRVLIDYIHWTLLPNLDALTLYHDDIAISHGLLSPPTTLASLLALVALIALALQQRDRRPLLSLGILWFFSGHLLTATVIPLLLAFEHRNYFPSIGLLLALLSALALEGSLLRARMRVALATLLFAFFAFTTWMRAQEWSDPVRLAISEASKRPDSSLAQYDRAIALMSAGTVNGRPTLEDGLLALDDNRHLPDASIMYEQVLITTSMDIGQPVRTDWWKSIALKLDSRPPTISDAKALANLNGCFIEKKCKEGLDDLTSAYSAAMKFPSPSSALLSVHAEFSWYLRDDKITAERDIRAAVARSPFDINGHRNLAILLMALNKFGEAQKEVDSMKRMNYFGIFDELIVPVQRALLEKEKAANAASGAQ